MRILIIEDDSRVAGFIEKGLRAEGWCIEVASDGQSGIERALADGNDLVILDLMLPDIDGVEVCRRLRERGLHTPVLMLTAKDAVIDKVEGFEAGADDYVTKPFAFEELLVRIKALSRRGGETDVAPALQVDDLMLEHRQHQVTRAGQPVELTPTEFALLEYLMSHANRVVSRAMIEEQVWGYQQDPLTNVVDVYIRRLRKKIDRDAARPLIHTVRGVGYQLKAEGG